MQQTEHWIADEVESAITSASSRRALETVRRVTALFASSAPTFEREQIDLFGSVLERLIKTLEIRAIADVGFRIVLAEMSAQLAPLSLAPQSVIRHLATHDDITVAGPVLTESARLTSDDLIGIAKTKSERHLLAMSGRWWLKEVVTDAILARHYPSVSRRLVGNPGARISPAGFATIVAQAVSDPELAVETGIRADLPPHLRDLLMQKATDVVRSRLLSRAPAHILEEIRRSIAAASAGISREMAKVRDFSVAIDAVSVLKQQGDLNESALLAFATQRKYEETVASLAELSLSRVEIIRPLMQSLRDDGVLVACKVAGLRWETTAKVLECRYLTGSMSSEEFKRAKDQFVRLDREEAARLLNFWKVSS
jgi:uncharacterized protein (DUF2336 family)